MYMMSRMQWNVLMDAVTNNLINLKINLKKTKFMVIKSTVVKTHLITDSSEIERMNVYRYLGMWITTNIYKTKVIKICIEVTCSSFIRIETCYDISLIQNAPLLNDFHSSLYIEA